MITSVCDKKIGEVKNKLPHLSDLVKKTDYDAKISEIEEIYFTTSDYIKFTVDILNAKIKQKELAKKYDISSLVKYSN